MNIWEWLKGFYTSPITFLDLIGLMVLRSIVYDVWRQCKRKRQGRND